MFGKADEAELQRIRRRAADLDVMLEVHGGTMFPSSFERTMQQTAAIGAKVIGCSSGMLLRPNVIDTLAAWDEHAAKTKARLKELAATAKSLGLIIGVENHLDFSLDELVELIKTIDSPQVGVIFDVGNSVGTLDDPCEAADLLGPYTVATHYKDFTIEEVTRSTTARRRSSLIRSRYTLAISSRACPMIASTAT
jgi:sugar phosphate isomerase/epimerase